MSAEILILVALVVVGLQLLIFWRLAAVNSQGSLEQLQQLIELMDRSLREEMARLREEQGTNARMAREESGSAIQNLSESLQGKLASSSRESNDQSEKLREVLEAKFEQIRAAVDLKLREIREDNDKSLEKMRMTVDEKLQATVEERFNSSFSIIRERLELVHKGLGEMQSLASGVGDLKRMMTNIKTRGTWGEVQLGVLLEQMLSSTQYEKNVATRPGSNERVEYAIKLPGRGADAGDCVWLPIDAKLPIEDYQRVVDAQEAADAVALDQAAKALEATIKNSAKDISSKYIEPPYTTDFALMFLPTEGLYAEVIRRPGLVEQLQRDYRIAVAGPTTLAALLNSLQMGFRTLAIEKRSSEVWAVLGGVKTEFGKFGTILEGLKKKLDTASNTIDEAAKRSRAIERKLRDVEALPSEESDLLEQDPLLSEQVELG